MNVISILKSPYVLSVPLGLTLVAACVAAAVNGDSDANPGPGLEHGRDLYERHCTVCHGADGRGDGQAAYLLHPAPRNFASGRFRLVSTRNGVPTTEDLIASIRRGMPGSAMPPWEWFAEEDLKDVTLYVQHLAVEGQIADLLSWAEEEGDEMSEPEARELAVERMTPGQAIDVGVAPPSDPVTLHEGQRLYLKSCAGCHGEQGAGDAPVNLAGQLLNEDGTPNTARNFTVGILKGGSTHEDIMRRIVGGLPGSPMPATDLASTEQASVLAGYVRSLIKPGAEERVLQRRQTVPVSRVPGTVPVDANDPVWAQTEAVWVALMPLWWRDNRVEGVIVRAVHDGDTIAFRLSWRDASNDHDLLGPESFSDAAALQISVEGDPPLCAMGDPAHPVDIAFWRAAWEEDGTVARNVRDRYPNMVDDGFPDLLGDLQEDAITARAAGNSQSVPARPGGTEALMATGLGTVSPRISGSSSWAAQGAWDDGYRDVVFTRSMRAEVDGEPALSPGLSAFLAFGVWDGTFRDRNGQKSVSVWHKLQVDP